MTRNRAIRAVGVSLLALGFLLAPAEAREPKLRFRGCPAEARARAAAAVEWLRDNVRLVDAKMGKNGLMDWPGNSRRRFARKLAKAMTIECVNSEARCETARKRGAILRGRVIPLLHQKQLELCANYLEDTAEYIRIIAHEVGHLVRPNVHRRDCRERYERPRFSQSLGLAAYHAYTGTDYAPADYTKYCPK